ncbi:twin transmembrane helix small protein [Sulfitobacter sp. M57]|uniref:twin transmembrane helix small protein n=1 Tax=unclassified Sulfitobacter TaxID=196795 RepID=UPI0023E2D3DC|nr:MULTISPECIES: twin transmembrane helix small protein [unclassified Sulfitobacter]MDF3416162.1 twin transmembrane helix small protein [Sulfitobacter sp. KE5]MDF3423641.1 twin transmembrane helix small protein [Sulfitobacter sp. KE43]MDF3434708.1 twin transmembrane helix small protein [Sulfitobacter sp. KE42]MDF3460347.1 twin transmembrane helix small protein [Sulfitobacter sp. S74]MDF3464245.1 twin transmembrane helix small protein [Sulfitobacter sp. Ks18]
MTDDPLFIVIVLAVLVVVVVLMMGLGGFASGGAFNKKNANKLMRYRIAAQFVAVLLIAVFVWLRGGWG